MKEEKWSKIGENFLSDILSNHIEQNNRLDNKANALLAISGVIFVLSASLISKPFSLKNIGLIIILITSTISCILSVLTIKFPKKDLPHSPHLMYYRGFENLTIEEYKEKLSKTIDSKEKLVDEYAKEIYAIVEQGLNIKYKLIKITSFVICTGFLISCIILILGVFT